MTSVYQLHLMAYYCMSLSAIFSIVNGTKNTYIASVVEYEPVGSPSDFENVQELLEANANKYVELILQASSAGSDIIVFPEYGITTMAVPRDRNASKPYLQYIPAIGVNACDLNYENISYPSTVTKILSCAAKNASIYVIVNLGEIRPCTNTSSNCPMDGVFQYNVNVVFDRHGFVVAKYAKTHLYFEDQFDTPIDSEENLSHAIFTSDFGVKFGIFICFDIIFYQPAIQMVETYGISHLIFTSAWVDELPFLTGNQAQSMWAFASNVTLLASGYHQPIGGQMGSGIYNGENGALNYSFDSSSGTKLVTAIVPVLNDTANVTTQQNNPGLNSSHFWLREDLTNYTTAVLQSNNRTLCTTSTTNLCCSIEYEFNDMFPRNDGQYRLIVFDGIRSVAQETDSFHWQVCGLVYCENDTLTSCTENNSELESSMDFKWFHLTASNVSVVDTVQPGFNVLNRQFQLVPMNHFVINKLGNGTFAVECKNSTRLDLKTVALIQKIYDGR